MLVGVLAVLVARVQRLRSLVHLAQVQVLHRPVAEIQQINCGRVVGDDARQRACAVISKKNRIPRCAGACWLERARGPDASVLEQKLVARPSRCGGIGMEAFDRESWSFHV